MPLKPWTISKMHCKCYLCIEGGGGLHLYKVPSVKSCRDIIFRNDVESKVGYYHDPYRAIGCLHLAINSLSPPPLSTHLFLHPPSPPLSISPYLLSSSVTFFFLVFQQSDKIVYVIAWQAITSFKVNWMFNIMNVVRLYSIVDNNI